MDEAAMNGHLEAVKWLHANQDEGCTNEAMESNSIAILEGNSASMNIEPVNSYLRERWRIPTFPFEVYQWLCANFPERTAATAERFGARYDKRDDAGMWAHFFEFEAACERKL
ncbi:hypothetical protein PybrP1_010074 [[Pythium] brassicae (nom. inval.)]|nr:hypothetical protein PybrP1_010074 [[Pythium] brassicae (nom. inval.)]